MQIEWFQAVTIGLISIASAFLALIIHARFTASRNAPRRNPFSALPAPEPAVFLFDNQDLVDATTPARNLLDSTATANTDWARLTSYTTPRFKDFERCFASLPEKGRFEMTSMPSEDRKLPLRLIAENVDGLARITLVDPEAEGQGTIVDALSQRAFEDELDVMRKTLDRLPALTWRETEDGTVTWANRAYILQAQAFSGEEDSMSWPVPRLFPVDDIVTEGPRRIKIDAQDNRTLWFDRYTFQIETGTVHFAIPADATVRAEKSLRSFVQTLTKTFADLPVGLAVFDRQRKLQLFNPALIDLTQLATEFLSSRPSLYAFLDRLREARMVPEPKDYRSWRSQMNELEKAAAAGFHSETWSLPGGQTYRVTGRPHLDGAVAFLFEDITSEISLTRRFRAEIEMGQEVLDQMPEAVAVFRPSGEMALSNTTYDQLWKVEPSTALGRVTITDSIRIWREDCEPTSLWVEATKFCAHSTGRKRMVADVRRHDGTVLHCRVSAISGGATMITFARIAQPETRPAMDKPVVHAPD